MIAFLLILLLPSSVFAGQNTGASFLRIGTGARPAALGGAYTALAADVDALYYNPGGLANLTRREFGATHAEYLLDTRFDFVGYAQPTSYGTLALGVTRLGGGGFEGRAADRTASGNFAASDTAYALSFARGLSRRTRLGGSVKYLQSTIAGYSAQTAAFDFGAQHALSGRPLTLGLSLLNVGRGMKFLDQRDPLPLTLYAGAAYRLLGVVNLVLDLRQQLHEGKVEAGVGTEYAVLPSFRVRAGYASQAGATGSDGVLGGLGAGFGLTMKSYRADYTFTPFGALGNVQRLSLGARW